MRSRKKEQVEKIRWRDFFGETGIKKKKKPERSCRKEGGGEKKRNGQNKGDGQKRNQEKKRKRKIWIGRL